MQCLLRIMWGSRMNQGASNIDIALQLVDEESYLTLCMNNQSHEMLFLSLQEARKLARQIIQQVHQAEVNISLKSTVSKKHNFSRS